MKKQLLFFSLLGLAITIKAQEPIKQPTVKAIKIFDEPKVDCDWKYEYPFSDHTYVLAIQRCLNSQDQEKNSTIYFGRDRGQTDQLFWKEKIAVQYPDQAKHEDFNGDGYKDVLIFKGTGARGSNELYYLYVANPKNKTLARIKGFETIANPSFHQKYKVIVGYGFAGQNYYSIYRISKNNTVYQLGKSFEDTFDGDQKELDQKIAQLLKTKS